MFWEEITHWILHTKPPSICELKNIAIYKSNFKKNVIKSKNSSSQFKKNAEEKSRNFKSIFSPEGGNEWSVSEFSPCEPEYTKVNSPTLIVARVLHMYIIHMYFRKSPMEVTMREPRNSQIHVSQAVPGASPLTWAMEGDAEINKVRLKKMFRRIHNYICVQCINKCIHH